MIKDRTIENWNKLTQELKVGDVVSGTVFQVESYGVYVDIGEQFYGIVLVPYIGDGRLESFSDYPQIGSLINTIVIGFSLNKGNMEFSYVGLSAKDYPRV